MIGEIFEGKIMKLFMEKQPSEDYFLLSHRALADVWKNEDDNYWESFLKE